MAEGYDPPATDNSGSEPVTDLPEDVENRLRIFLVELFQLDFNELMLLKCIMNKMTLTDFGREMEKLAKSNVAFSRFRAFQTRKRLLAKLGAGFAAALLTTGQKKPLKKP